jgi:hypothetical protein
MHVCMCVCACVRACETLALVWGYVLMLPDVEIFFSNFCFSYLSAETLALVWGYVLMLPDMEMLDPNADDRDLVVQDREGAGGVAAGNLVNHRPGAGQDPVYLTKETVYLTKEPVYLTKEQAVVMHLLRGKDV